MPNGLPMSWRAKWPGPHPVYVEQAQGRLLLTPFHNVALISPATTQQDVDRHPAAFAGRPRTPARVATTTAGRGPRSRPALCSAQGTGLTSARRCDGLRLAP